MDIDLWRRLCQQPKPGAQILPRGARRCTDPKERDSSLQRLPAILLRLQTDIAAIASLQSAMYTCRRECDEPTLFRKVNGRRHFHSSGKASGTLRHKQTIVSSLPASLLDRFGSVIYLQEQRSIHPTGLRSKNTTQANPFLPSWVLIPQFGLQNLPLKQSSRFG